MVYRCSGLANDEYWKSTEIPFAGNRRGKVVQTEEGGILMTWHQENMRVQYKDTDQMGVVHHVNYVIWFEVGRSEWMSHFGMTYSELEEQGLLLPVMDVQVQYKASARYDDCVSIFT